MKVVKGRVKKATGKIVVGAGDLRNKRRHTILGIKFLPLKAWMYFY